MAYPAGVSTCNLTLGEAFTAFGEENTVITAIVTPYFGSQANRIIWSATGEVMAAFSKTYTSTPGGSLSIPVPHVNQAGWISTNGSAFTMWAYKVAVTITYDNQTVTWEQSVQPLVGQTTVDLDTVPVGGIGTPVSAPLPEVLSVNGMTGHVTVSGGGASDHGALTGLSDDDHPQYHNNARGDVRYYTKSQVDSSLGSKADLVGGKVPSAQMPVLATFEVVSVANQAARLALTSSQVQLGDVAVQTTPAAKYILGGTGDPSIDANWLLLEDNDAVTSVNGYVGVIVLSKADVGLGNVDNTADPTAVSQAEAEAGTGTTIRAWNAQRVKQAIQSIENVAPGQIVDCLWNGTDGWTNPFTGVKVTTRPTSRTDVRIWLSGGPSTQADPYTLLSGDARWDTA